MLAVIPKLSACELSFIRMPITELSTFCELSIRYKCTIKVLMSLNWLTLVHNQRCSKLDENDDWTVENFLRYFFISMTNLKCDSTVALQFDAASGHCGSGVLLFQSTGA